MLVISTQKWSILAKFAKNNPAKSAVFYWLFLGEVSPWNFPWNRPIFLRICSQNSFEIWLFSAKIMQNRPIFLRILTFLPRNRLIFPRICPWKSHEIVLFFSAKYQKPCYNDLSAQKGYFFHASVEVYERVAKSVISVMKRLCITDAFDGCEKVEKTF